MVGYVTKDFGKAHYKVASHNVSAQVIIVQSIYCNLNVLNRILFKELTNGRREHDALLTSFDDSKKVL